MENLNFKSSNVSVLRKKALKMTFNTFWRGNTKYNLNIRKRHIIFTFRFPFISFKAKAKLNMIHNFVLYKYAFFSIPLHFTMYLHVQCTCMYNVPYMYNVTTCTMYICTYLQIYKLLI